MTELKRHTQAIEELTEKSKNVTEGPVEARRLTVQQAMDEVLDLFKKKKRLFYSDIVEELRIDLSTAMKACEQLRKRGLIEGEPNGKTRTAKTRR